MKYLSPLFLLLAGCTTQPHSGQDCADQGSTNAHFGIFGLAASLQCYSTASDSTERSDTTQISSARQLLELISDSTYSGQSEQGTSFHVYSRQDGRMIGRTLTRHFDEGTWEVTSDAKYCRKWNKWRDAGRDCFYVYLIEGDRVRFKAIDKSFESEGRIVPGDSENLKNSMSTVLGAPLLIASAVYSSQPETTGGQLTADEIKALFVGNTETGSYVSNGREIAYSEYYRKDGRISGTDAIYGKYQGFYEIREDGCFYLDYPDDQYDGCYYFEHLQGNEYRSRYPDGSSRIVTILNGDPKNLDK